MTQHTYWNLDGNLGGSDDNVLSQILSINGKSFLDTDQYLVPNGKILLTADHLWMDFNKPKAIGQDIKQGTVTPSGGYDNAWVFNNWQPHQVIQPRVTLRSLLTNITLQMLTDQASVQFYRFYNSLFLL